MPAGRPADISAFEFARVRKAALTYQGLAGDPGSLVMGVLSQREVFSFRVNVMTECRDAWPSSRKSLHMEEKTRRLICHDGVPVTRATVR
jgi:hypothetical protein